MKKVWFKLNRKEAGDQILRQNEAVNNLQSGAMNQVLSLAQAQFLQQFGVQGSFEIRGYTTDRSSMKLVPADKQTAILLKRHPGWLSQFTDNLVI